MFIFADKIFFDIGYTFTFITALNNVSLFFKLFNCIVLYMLWIKYLSVFTKKKFKNFRLLMIIDNMWQFVCCHIFKGFEIIWYSSLRSNINKYIACSSMADNSQFWHYDTKKQSRKLNTLKVIKQFTNCLPFWLWYTYITSMVNANAFLVSFR